MSGEIPVWNNPAVDHQSASTGPIFRYNQSMQHTSPSAPQGGEEVHLNFCIQDLLDNSQISRYHHIVALYISLDNASFQSIYQLRSSPCQPELSTHHASLFSSPPPDIWNAIVQLRVHSTWPHSQRFIIDNLNTRIVQDLQRPPLPRVLTGGLIPPPGRRASQAHHASPSGSSDSSARGYQGAEGSIDAVGLARKSPNPQEVFKNNMSKTAPQGQCWRCPSANCKKSFVRMGHLKNHLSQLHPDFLACHADYDPDDYLEIMPPSRTPSDETRVGNVRGSTVRTNSQGTIVTSERPRARTRTPSFTPPANTASRSDAPGSRNRQRPGINRHHSDSTGWTHDAMIGEFEPVTNSSFGMTGVAFPNADPFQGTFYEFNDSEHQHMDVDTAQFDHRPPDIDGSRGGSSASPGH